MERAQRLARKAEETTAKLHGAKLTPGSGSRAHTKNDAANNTWSYEVKSTSNKGYRLTHADLLKAEAGARVDGHRMAFIIDFLGGMERFRRTSRFVVTSEDDFIEREQELEFLRKDNAELLSKIMTDC
jgi:hypothetical protein